MFTLWMSLGAIEVNVRALASSQLHTLSIALIYGPSGMLKQMFCL